MWESLGYSGHPLDCDIALSLPSRWVLIKERARPARAVLMSHPQGMLKHRNTETLETYTASTDTQYSDTVNFGWIQVSLWQKS